MRSLCSCHSTLVNLVHASTWLQVHLIDIISLMVLMLSLIKIVKLWLALFPGVPNI